MGLGVRGEACGLARLRLVAGSALVFGVLVVVAGLMPTLALTGYIEDL